MKTIKIFISNEDDQSILYSNDDDRYHVYIESCLGALHTLGKVVKCVIFDYVLREPW